MPNFWFFVVWPMKNEVFFSGLGEMPSFLFEPLANSYLPLAISH